MDTIQAFKEASAVLQKDPRYLALSEIRRKNDADKSLEELTQNFAQTREALSAELEKEIRNNDLVVELNAKANKLYGEIMAHDGIIAYNKAKVDIDQLVGYIDAIITTALEGGNPMTVEQPSPAKKEDPSCTGSCATCSGCQG